MKHFHALVKNPTNSIYMLEIYLRAENIIEAGKYLTDSLGAIGVFSENVIELVEVNDGPA